MREMRILYESQDAPDAGLAGANDLCFCSTYLVLKNMGSRGFYFPLKALPVVRFRQPSIFTIIAYHNCRYLSIFHKGERETFSGGA